MSHQRLVLQSLFTFSFTSFEPAFLFVLHSSFSQSNLHIGFNLRAFVICTSFLFNGFNFSLILFISVLTDLTHHSNSNNWTCLFLSGSIDTYFSISIYLQLRIGQSCWLQLLGMFQFFVFWRFHYFYVCKYLVLLFI